MLLVGQSIPVIPEEQPKLVVCEYLIVLHFRRVRQMPRCLEEIDRRNPKSVREILYRLLAW